jgi:uncharacterized protein with PQ loop repeat
MRKLFVMMSDKAWENFGVVFGALACATIVRQIIHEWRIPEPSSVSLWFVGGFFVSYLFWFFYGLRFARRAIWLPNGIAAALQIVFAFVILSKG